MIPPLSEIGRGSEWRFRLVPLSKSGEPDFDDATVKVKAKDLATYPWLDLSGSASVDGLLTVCVPDTLALDEEVAFMVEVESIGEIDPRAVVVN